MCHCCFVWSEPILLFLATNFLATNFPVANLAVSLWRITRDQPITQSLSITGRFSRRLYISKMCLNQIALYWSTLSVYLRLSWFASLTLWLILVFPICWAWVSWGLMVASTKMPNNVVMLQSPMLAVVHIVPVVFLTEPAELSGTWAMFCKYHSG